MIRDELMQRVIHRDMEPITPFIDRIEELYREYCAAPYPAAREER